MALLGHAGRPPSCPLLEVFLPRPVGAVVDEDLRKSSAANQRSDGAGLDVGFGAEFAVGLGSTLWPRWRGTTMRSPSVSAAFSNF